MGLLKLDYKVLSYKVVSLVFENKQKLKRFFLNLTSFLDKTKMIGN